MPKDGLFGIVWVGGVPMQIPKIPDVSFDDGGDAFTVVMCVIVGAAFLISLVPVAFDELYRWFDRRRTARKHG